jgi:hypothetical protein
MKLKIRSTWNKLRHKVSSVGEKMGLQGAFKALEKDAQLGRTLHSEVIAAMNTLQEKQPSIKELLEKAYGYAVLPAIGKASLVLGGAYGIGEVFVKNRVIGYAGIGKFDLGVQLGGTTFHEMIVFNEKEAWNRFKAGKYSFAADAGVAIVKAGAQASKGFGAPTVAFVFNEGGMLLDLAIGIQKFAFKPTVLGRLRTNEGAEPQKNQDTGSEDEGPVAQSQVAEEREDDNSDQSQNFNQRPPESNR